MADNDIDDWEDVPLEDDWEDVGEAAPVAEEPGMGEALARGGAQGVTMGFGDEASGFLASLFGEQEPRTVGRGIDAPLDPRSGYEVERDILRGQNVAAQEASPGAYLAGELGGALLTAPATGMAAGGLVKAAAPKLGALGGRAAAALGSAGGLISAASPRIGGKAVAALGAAGGLAKAVAPKAAGVVEGVGTGAVEGLGRSEAEFGSGEMLQDVGMGAGVGALLPTAFGSAGAATRGAVQKFAGDPGQRMVAAAKSKLRQAGKTPTEAARFGTGPKLQREYENIRSLASEGGEGMLPQTSSELLGSMEGGLAKVSSEMNAINDAVSEAGGIVDSARVAAQVQKLADPYRGMTGAESIVADIDRVANGLKSTPAMTMVAAQRQRQLLFEQLKLESPLTHGRVGKQIYGAFRDSMENAVAEVTDSATAERWSELNSLVSTGIGASGTASVKSAREAGQAIPTFYGALGALGGESRVGGGLTGMALGAAAKESRERSPGIKSAYQRGMAGIAERGLPAVPGADLLSQVTSRTMAGQAIPTAEERRNDLISMLAQQSQDPSVQQSAQAIEQASQQPGNAGAVEYFNQVQTNAELRKELENR